MTISVIIPTWRDNESLGKCIDSLLNQNYPKKDFEIILTSKKKLKIKNKNVISLKIGSRVNHAQARNIAARCARGEILAFCDDDCILPKNWFTTAVKYFKKNNADLIGGPVVAPKNNSFSYRISGYLAGSRFAFGFAAYKFTSFKEKEARDSDLILANNFVRKSIFQKIGGFDKDQVPCEENLLYERVRLLGYKLLYVPKLACTHPSKPIFLPLAEKIYFYATGRGLLVARAPETFRFQYLIPSIFIFSLIFLIGFAPFSNLALLILISIFFIYSFLNVLNSILIFTRLERNYLVFLVAPVATFIVHVSYGFGFLNGFFRYLLKKRKAVKMPSKY